MHYPFFFQKEEVLPAIIHDNVKEMIVGEFNSKVKEASCHLKQTESFIHGGIQLRER